MRIYTTSVTPVTIRYTADWTLSFKQICFLTKKLNYVLDLRQDQVECIISTFYTNDVTHMAKTSWMSSDERAVMEVYWILANGKPGSRDTYFLSNLNTGRAQLLTFVADPKGDAEQISRFTKSVEASSRPSRTFEELLNEAAQKIVEDSAIV